MAILLATKIVSPNMWAWVADRSSRVLPVVRIAALLALVIFLGLYWARTFWWIAAAMLGFSFFWNAVLPQVEAATLNHLGARKRRYGRVRLWGSLGFIVAVLALGPVVERYGAGAALPAVALALLGVWLTTLLIPEPTRPTPSREQLSFKAVFKKPEVVAILVCCLLMQASHAPFYTFFSIYLNDYGYSKNTIAVLWAFGTACEIAVFYFMHRLHRSFSLTGILAFSFLVTALRWILVARFPESLAVIIFTQSLHAVTFGAYHASALQIINTLFQGPHQHRGMALYGSASFGVGGAVGSFYSGYIWAAAGPAVTFYVASGVALSAAVLVVAVVAPGYRRVSLDS